MTWEPPEKPGMFANEDEAVRKIVTWAVLGVFVTICFVLTIALIVWAGRIIF